MSQVRDAAYAAAKQVLSRYPAGDVRQVAIGWYAEAIETGFDGDLAAAREGMDGLCDAIVAWGGDTLDLEETLDARTSGTTPAPAAFAGAEYDHSDLLSEAVSMASSAAWEAASAA